ncbi:MAG: glutathione S-transferase N-terminal domain-containing protein, partial [Gammaproteobacteria bacterium]
MSDRPILYSFWRSSTSYRVRIALNLKGIAYETVAVNLEANGGEHHRASYRRLNPEQMVPVLSDGGRVIRQSLAIIEYLDARHAQAPLLIPREPLAAAQVRGLALTIACDVQPFGPARVLGYLERTFGANEAQRQAWMRHW